MAREADSLLTYIGEFGQYQLWLFVNLFALGLLSFEAYVINFVAGDQKHWCDVEGISHLPYEQQKCVAIPQDEDGDYETCKHYVMNYTQYSDMDLIGMNCTHYNPEGLSTTKCQHWIYDRSQYVSTITSRWDLVCDDTWKVSLTSTFWMLGYLLGTVSVGATSDAIGRKKCYFIFFAIKLVGCFLTTFAPGYWWFCLGRMIIGFGGVCFLAVYVLMMEVVAEQYRAVLGSLYWALYVIMYALYVGQAYLIRDDIRYQMAFTIPQVIMFLYWFIIPESPRWLLVKEKYNSGEKVIKNIAAVNRIELPEDFDVKKIIVKEEKSQGKCATILRSPKFCCRFAIICLHWFTDSLVYYALSLNTGRLPGDAYLNTLIWGLLELPSNILVMFLLRWKYTGRRITCSWCLIIAGIINFSIIPCLIYDVGTAVTTLALTGNFFVSMGFTGIYVWSAELIPTEVRNLGMGTASLCARVSGMVASFAGGPLYDVWLPLPNVIFGVLGLASGISALLLPETLGRKLVETVDEAVIAFDSDNKGMFDSTQKKTTNEPQILRYTGNLAGMTELRLDGGNNQGTKSDTVGSDNTAYESMEK